MILLKTVKKGQRNEYWRVDSDAENIVIHERKSGVRCVETGKRGEKHYLLLDSDGNTIPEANRYVNEVLPFRNASDNTRHKTMNVLVRLYSFTYLMDLNVRSLDSVDVHRLKMFLRGDGDSRCSNRTVNSYLGTIRAFFEEMHIECEALFRRHPIKGDQIKDDEFSITTIHYAFDSNLPVQESTSVPKYITLDEYIKLLGFAKAVRNWVAIILMHLMFRYGMRLGECLGLTEEDFVYLKIDGKEVPTLIVRNRLSNRRDQCAKGKMVPQSSDDYRSEDYIKEWKDDDYAHYYLTESDEFVETFTRFIHDTREDAEKNHPDNYASSEADIVDPETFAKKGLKKNHYIFLNRLGRRLSGQLWGCTLKEFFIQADIPIDKGKKRNNLSHRFRHGFAMMRAHFMDPPVPVQVLQKMMHHHRISSTMIYYNLTDEEKFKLQSQLQERLYESFPEFKTLINGFLKDM